MKTAAIVGIILLAGGIFSYHIYSVDQQIKAFSKEVKAYVSIRV
ncbi:hypothetical protein lbkm_1744 [Lachnospiraceae bacterium KM106-2]|nr:hypothetical protein lbkm_1744 [Lachnospiraceae bacterium KM106-2]